MSEHSCNLDDWKVEDAGFEFQDRLSRLFKKDFTGPVEFGLRV